MKKEGDGGLRVVFKIYNFSGYNSIIFVFYEADPAQDPKRQYTTPPVITIQALNELSQKYLLKLPFPVKVCLRKTGT